MPGKPNRPLFELLRDQPKLQTKTPRAAAPATESVEAKPAPAAKPQAPSRIEVMKPGLEALEAGGPGEPFLRVRKSAFYLGVAGVLAIALLVWIVAFTRGRAVGGAEERQKFGVVNPPSPPLGDPLNQKPAVTDPTPDNTPQANDAGDAGKGGKPQPKKPVSVAGVTGAQVNAGSGEILTATGRTNTDPRTPGMNYLVLTILAEDEAAEAVAFLARNNVDAFAVPNKGDRRAASGRKTSVLVVTAGITADQYKKDPIRTQMEQAATKLGAAWKKQGGSVDFAQHYWQKYDR